MQHSGLSVLSKPSYFLDLAARIAQASEGDHILLVTMSFEPNQREIGDLIDQLCAAAKRGANVQLFVDAYAFYFIPLSISEANWRKPPLAYIRPPAITAKLAALDKLARAGGSYTITNIPATMAGHPFSGRSHLKFTLINNLVYMGGCNLDNVYDIDIMLRWTDQATAKWLDKFAQKIRSTDTVSSAMKNKDICLPLDKQTKLLIDAGVRHQSMILDHAIRLIDEAKRSVFITCQFYPDSSIAKPLSRALERGVKVIFIYNNPLKHAFPYNALFTLTLIKQARRMPASLLSGQLPISCNFLHAKVIATESGALVGSHNFVDAGVHLGTAECAVLQHNGDFARRVVKSIEQDVATLTSI